MKKLILLAAVSVFVFSLVADRLGQHGGVLVSAFAEDRSAGTHFGMVGVTTGQTARLNVVAIPPNPCVATLSFFDSTGALLAGPMDAILVPGQATFLDLSATSALPVGAGPNTRAEIRGDVTQPPGPGGRPCTATLEVFENGTGRTSFVLIPLGPIQRE